MWTEGTGARAAPPLLKWTRMRFTVVAEPPSSASLRCNGRQDARCRPRGLPVFSIAVLTVAVLGATLMDFVAGHRRVRSLASLRPVNAGPPVSIIVAARNEARNIEEAARSLLRLDYTPLELIFVDDRSTDATPAILDRLAHLRPGF